MTSETVPAIHTEMYVWHPDFFGGHGGVKLGLLLQNPKNDADLSGCVSVPVCMCSCCIIPPPAADDECTLLTEPIVVTQTRHIDQ